MTDTAVDLLKTAEEALSRFQTMDNCAWCKDKAKMLEATIRELKEALPLANQLREKVNNLARDNLGGVLDDIRAHRESQSLGNTTPTQTSSSANTGGVPQNPEPFTGELSPNLFDGFKVVPRNMFKGERRRIFGKRERKPLERLRLRRNDN